VEKFPPVNKKYYNYDYMNYKLYFYFISSYILGLIIIPILSNIKIDSAAELHNFQKEDLKKQKNETPILGGIIFIIPILFYLYQIKEYMLIIFLIFSLLIGFIDDFIKLVDKTRQNGISRDIKIILYLINYLFFNKFIKQKNILDIKECISYFAIIIGVLVTDGVDGLLGILSIISCLFIMIFSSELVVKNISKIVITCLCPFLIFNWNPAKIFMGDSGSSFLANILFYLFSFNKSSIFELSSVYLIGFFSSLLQILSKKIINKKFLPVAPFHHSLESINWTNNEIILFYIISYLIILIYYII